MSKKNEDYKNLIAHWDAAFRMTEEEKRQTMTEEEAAEFMQLAPSPKLASAAAELAGCENALDYGCGNGWAGIIAARSGCKCVTCADPAPNACETAACLAKLFRAEESVHTVCVTEDWLAGVPEGSYDGIFCSNVLDVVPPEMSDEIIKNLARAACPGAKVTVGLNYYLPPEQAAEKGMELKDGCALYLDGVLRLVTRTDEDWRERLGRYFTVERLDRFAWPGEDTERRRLFFLRKN